MGRKSCRKDGEIANRQGTCALCTALEAVYCNVVTAAEVESYKAPCSGNAKTSGDKLPLETAAALHSISAEVLHEIVHTLNFLRYLVEQDGNAALAPEALGFARNEIARLERLVGNLRQLKLPPAQRIGKRKLRFDQGRRKHLRCDGVRQVF